MSIASIRSEVRRMKARVSIADAFAALSNDERYRLMDRLFHGGPASGYLKHCELMARGSDCRSRLMISANRTGKTVTGAYEAAVHLTGRYPDWWDGMRFDRPIICWCAGDTAKTTREFVQAALLGDGIEYGTGTVPRGSIIGKPTTKSGVARAVDTFEVRHKTGGISTCVLKSYDQGEEAFMGKAVDFIWLDEEPPIRVVTECIIRTMTCNGRLLQTFTPIWGLTETVQHFMPSGSIPDPMPNGVHIVQASWEDAPHLTPEMRSELESHIPPFQRDARMRGIPALGSGAIYPIPESEIVVQPFEIPDYWPRAYGMDVGWNRTAAVWGARDPDSGTIYLYAEYYRGEAEPSVHAAAIRARGEWIPGVIDPAARGRGQADGRQLLQDYIDLGLNIDIANNAVEAGIYRGWEMMSGGRIKVFATLQNWISEYRVYRRDEKGRVVKDRDHCLSGDTLVWTDRGKIPIRDMIGTTGHVVGIDGRFVEYKACRQYGFDDVYRYSMDGKTVDCTSDHLILTNKGWVAARDCFGGIGYNTISEHTYRFDLCKLRLLKAYQKTAESIKNFLVSVTTCVASTSNAMECACIESCMSMCMADAPTGAGSIYTMLTGTPRTMIQATWSLFQRKTTLVGIRRQKERSALGSMPTGLGRLQKSGIRLRKEGHGIVLTMLKTVTSYMLASIEHVTIAAKCFLLPSRRDHVMRFAQTTARRRIEGNPWLTMREGNASSADADSRQTNTASKGLVAENAEVFCLYVPDGHGFVVNDGLIVHNCLDASRYLWMSGMDQAIAKPAAREKHEPKPYRGEMGWM